MLTHGRGLIDWLRSKSGLFHCGKKAFKRFKIPVIELKYKEALEQQSRQRAENG